MMHEELVLLEYDGLLPGEKLLCEDLKVGVVTERSCLWAQSTEDSNHVQALEPDFCYISATDVRTGNLELTE